MFRGVRIPLWLWVVAQVLADKLRWSSRRGMRTMTRGAGLVVWGVLWFSMAGCSEDAGRPAQKSRAPSDASRAETVDLQGVREPAVAGLFYPAAPDALDGLLDDLLREAKPVSLGTVRGLISPHAGYEYSGPVAAWGYRQLAGRPIRTVVILAPSHYARFQGISLPKVAVYTTPLGRIPVSAKVQRLAQRAPFAFEPRCHVSRPGWFRQSAKRAPPFGGDTPHTWEHSLEVQLPFLQKVLGQFELVPAVFGETNPSAAAKALKTIVDEETLVVASSDLSHYYPYSVAMQLDASCVRAICDLDVQWMQYEEACGKLPILTLMHLARELGWKAHLLDYRNSGDTAGQRDQVVGYASIAFYEGPAEESEEAGPAGLTAEEQQYLLRLARESLVRAVRGQALLELDEQEVPARLRQRQACFVTLTKQGALRGCIGHIFGCMPLYRAVIENAANAGLEDPRFPPVRIDELDQIHIEISVLSQPKRLDFRGPEELLAKLRPGVDGVVFVLEGRRATYLPQVWEQIPDKEQFLNQLALKAKLPSSAWQDPQAIFLTYQVQAFEEETEP
ncbi:MAG TPA: AmmeMemoRadiSam system protein B [Planctomycetes bacterium]|nr:AmmeMemoRadiSam system protein B [Planctomycetota bacterium]